MPSCAVFDCPNRQCGKSKKTFHLFPFSRPDVLQQWLANMKREFWTPSKRSVLCSDHFESSCFDKTGCTTRIRSDAVPTIFSSPNSKKKRKKVVLQKKKKREFQDFKENGENTETTSSFEARYSKRKRTQKSFDPDFVYEESFYKLPWMNSQPRVPAALHSKASPQKSSRTEVTSPIASKTSTEANSPSSEKNFSQLRKETPLQVLETDTLSTVKSENEDGMEGLPEHIPDSESGSLPDDFEANETKRDQENEDLEQVRQLSTSLHKITSKDKVTHLPNNFIHFEFATPRRQVIVELNSNAENSGLRCNSLSELLKSLKEKNLLTSEGEHSLSVFGDIPSGLVRLNTKRDCEILPDKKAHEEAKNFSSLLYLNSHGAYDLLNEIFMLPSISVLQSRLQVVDFWPGFTKEALTRLGSQICKTPQEKLCSVMFDFVSLKPECFYTDFGREQNTNHRDNALMPNETLIFTACGLGSNWKLPFGYFFSRGMSSECVKNLLLEAISILIQYGLNVKAVVCAGSRRTIRVARLLECCVRPDISNEIVTGFPSPCDESEMIHLIFSVGHTLPLIRNLLSDKGTLRSSLYGEIQWKFLNQLISPSKIMKIDSSCVTQDLLKFNNLLKVIRKCGSCFNSAVTRALQQAERMKLKNFENCRSTLDFISDINRSFDLLNARNPITSEDRPPIHCTTLLEQAESLLNLSARLLDLRQLPSMKRIVDGGRWMSVTLLAFTLKSVSQLATELLKDKTILYFNTFRVNLDHSDMVLSYLQRHNCWSDIPAPSTFRNAYKDLHTNLHRHFLHHYDFDGEEFTVGQGHLYLFRNNFRSDPTHSGGFVIHSVSIIDLKAEEEYRANCVLDLVAKRLSCPDCLSIIFDENVYKDRDGRVCGIHVTRPSKYVMSVLKYVETVLKMFQSNTNALTVEQLVIRIFSEYCMFQRTFGVHKTGQVHFSEEPFHVICLVKVIIRTFISLRNCRYSKKDRGFHL